MSGIIGHVTYAVAAYREAVRMGLSAAKIAEAHWPVYLAGSYLGADIMTLPSGTCPHCGSAYGYATAEETPACPEDGTPLTPYTVEWNGQQWSPRDVHRLFYGRSHLLFGWQESEAHLQVDESDLVDYWSAAAADIHRFSPDPSRSLAHLLGWMAHVVGDALIKSVLKGLDLYLLDGPYTPRNRPIQDLYCFHRIGREEWGLDWEVLLDGLARTEPDPMQAHSMRVGPARGQLAECFPDGWRDDLTGLLDRVMVENRRYQQVRNPRLLRSMRLEPGPAGPRCVEELRALTGGLAYHEMMELAEAARFREAVRTIGVRCADQFATLEDALKEVTL